MTLCRGFPTITLHGLVQRKRYLLRFRWQFCFHPCDGFDGSLRLIRIKQHPNAERLTKANERRDLT